MKELLIIISKNLNEFSHVFMAIIGAFANRFFHAASENEKMFTKRNFAVIFTSGFAAVIAGALFDNYQLPDLVKFAVCGVIGWMGGNTVMDMAASKIKGKIEEKQ